MSAVSGVLRLNSSVDAGSFCRRLLDLQRERGPDDESICSGSEIALGVRHLFRSQRHRVEEHRTDHAIGSYRIAWDGRLDNRGEILEALSPGNTNLNAANDAELVVAAWRLWGEQTPCKLLGDFAFGLWDSQSQTLFCIRDAVGARPLYYTMQRDFFAFASDDDVLTQLPGVSTEWHPDRLVYGALPQFTGFDWSQSWRRDVRILMPGHVLAIGARGGVRTRRYHSWPTSIAPFRGGAIDAAEVFGALLRQATRDRIRQHDQIGLIASGGLDSLCVAAASALEAGGRPVSQFSIVHDDLSGDLESRSIQHCAETFGFKRQWVSVPSMSGMCDLADLSKVRAIRHPVDSSIVPIGLMCLAARRAGVASLLTGVSGDCVLNAPDSYIWDIARDLGFREALREVRLASKTHTYLYGRRPLRTLAWFAARQNAPSLLRKLWRALRRGDLPQIPLAASDPDTQAELQRVYQRRWVEASERSALDEAGSAAEAYFRGMGPFGVQRGLEGYERVAGRWGIELADPFSDRRLIEFCASLPTWLRSGAGYTKRPGRDWVSRYLNAEFVYRFDKPHLGDYLPE